MNVFGRLWIGTILFAPALAGCAGHADASEGAGGESSELESSATVEAGTREVDCFGARSSRRSFAVFSDPHLYDTALGTEGAAFEAYLASDRKMLVQSEPILRQVVSRIIAEHPAFVLVPGDLTKDGEWLDHVRFAEYMATLEQAGIEVYVVPGNHDVSNPDASRYDASGATPVRAVDEREFSRIYREFGYGQALDRDTDSLSYLAEPAPDLWLLALDSTRHRENTSATGPITGGRFSADTRAWALSKLKLAKRLGKRVIGMMHHGLVEHYTGQTLLFPEYVIEDYTALSKDFADAGLPVVFTGHFHANDVTAARWDDGSHLFDVETGSLVTAPSPFRFVEYDPRTQQMVVKTEHVTQLPGYSDFASWAHTFLDDGMTGLVAAELSGSSLVDAATAKTLAPVIAGALEVHYAGDEPPADAVTQQVAGMLNASSSAVGKAWGYSLLSLHNDLAPVDNDVVLDLADGSASAAK